MNKDISYLLSCDAIRERTQRLYDYTREGKTNFEIHEEKLPAVADFVLEVIRDNYPTLEIPFHSRWGHFQVGEVDRNAKLNEIIKDLDPIEKARTKLDLVITSVLLDAVLVQSGLLTKRIRHLIVQKALALQVGICLRIQTFQVMAHLKQKLLDYKRSRQKDIEVAFQVSEENPLVGLEGRAALLCALGKCVASKPEVFKDGRPGNIIDHMIETKGKSFAAQDLLKAVLINFGDIWPSRISVEGVNLGDVWNHPLLGERSDLSSLIPFHKLSQWLTYSLIEPIEEAGVEVHSASEMTGLAEYRNGGLLIDSGLLSLKDSELLNKAHKPDSELIIEWRALTVVMLDKIADIVRERLGFTSDEFPLAKVLEGGTWWAGRRIAKSKRADSSPPLKLDSDGTVF